MQPFWELIIKMPFAILIYFVGVRLFGLKEMAQATAVEFGFAVMIVSIVWDMSVSTDFQLWQIPIVLAVMWIIIYAIDWGTSRHKRLEKIVLGEPKLLVKNGVVNTDMLEKERISIKELESKLRLQGVFDIEEVELAYVEVSGQISVKKKGRDDSF